MGGVGDWCFGLGVRGCTRAEGKTRVEGVLAWFHRFSGFPLFSGAGYAGYWARLRLGLALGAVVDARASGKDPPPRR